MSIPHSLSLLTLSSMRISKESLFNILNLQTIATDESMINLFSQRGDADYLIEVVGTYPSPLISSSTLLSSSTYSQAAGRATRMQQIITGNHAACSSTVIRPITSK
jgi:hypothetical protein